jgi:hypothetical protein
MMGVWGLFFFMVGYDLVRNDLQRNEELASGIFRIKLGRWDRGRAYRTAALCSEVWQKRNRTSFKDFVNVYLLDMVDSGRIAAASRAQLAVDEALELLGSRGRIDDGGSNDKMHNTHEPLMQDRNAQVPATALHRTSLVVPA